MTNLYNCNDTNNTDSIEANNIFQSLDSISSSIKYDLLELFRSSSSNQSHTASTSSPKKATLPDNHPKTKQDEANRSRSSSLATQQEEDENEHGSASQDNNHKAAIFDFSLCSTAAASLANAGRVADNMRMDHVVVNASCCPSRKDQEDEDDEEPELVHTPQAGPQENPAALAVALSEDELRLSSPSILMEHFEEEESPASDSEEWLPTVVVPTKKTTTSTTATTKKKKKKKRTRKIYEPTQRVYVQYTDRDVLCQRGGKANTHPGNLRFREAKDDLQPLYFSTPKVQRTSVSQQLVDTVHAWHGRFLKHDKGGGWYECHNHVARTKAGQALRETYTPEDRAAKRAKYAKTKKKHEKKPQGERRV
mmetsp:Transcript_18994/g.40862  ORF Transcript_18994/g.40862 Transcript_18994/m.40862 type:complete len:365 (-) Transcript_18994:2995-4089(-)